MMFDHWPLCEILSSKEIPAMNWQKILDEFRAAKDMLATSGPDSLNAVADVLAKLEAGSRALAEWLRNNVRPNDPPKALHAAMPTAFHTEAAKLLAEVKGMHAHHEGVAAAAVAPGKINPAVWALLLQFLATLLQDLLPKT